MDREAKFASNAAAITHEDSEHASQFQLVTSTLTPSDLEADLKAKGIDPAVITEIVNLFVQYGPTLLNWILSFFKVASK